VSVAVAIAPAGGAALDAPARERLAARVGEAQARARARGRPVLASLTLELAAEADPSAIAFASRLAGEPLFCLEQPEDAGSALAALGSALAIREAGPDRFARAASRWRRACADAVADSPEGPRGAGLVAVGGFSFAPDGGSSPAWTGFEPASLDVPEVALARREGTARLTLIAAVAPDDDRDEVAARMERRAADLRSQPLPMLDPAPADRSRVASMLAPEHYESAVARGVERIRAGELEKVVLAREVDVHGPADHDAAAIVGVLREGFPGCYVLCVARGDAAFVAASPELLVRREGQRASTVALAGSMRRSADPAVDDHLGEQLLRSAKDREENAIVARSIERTLGEHAVWVTAAPEPVLARMANIQHLATPIRAQLARPMGVLDLAGRLHPTPAVGGEPQRLAQETIPALEGMDRGWYAGAVGWTDSAQDGELCVALRCALLRGRLARCYAGGGVVRDSDPAAELAETEVKLAALLPVLAA
jgi:salicylate biosynthesis isochorismate synthase/menaquinone-specific isochorismate synthase